MELDRGNEERETSQLKRRQKNGGTGAGSSVDCLLEGSIRERDETERLPLMLAVSWCSMEVGPR